MLFIKNKDLFHSCYYMAYLGISFHTCFLHTQACNSDTTMAFIQPLRNKCRSDTRENECVRGVVVSQGVWVCDIQGSGNHKTHLRDVNRCVICNNTTQYFEHYGESGHYFYFKPFRSYSAKAEATSQTHKFLFINNHLSGNWKTNQSLLLL